MAGTQVDNRVPLWLDCDPGHDDAFAILLSAHHPSLNLLGISTVHGNTSLENTVTNAGSILEAIGRSDIPVHPGSKKPFCRPVVHASNIHGASGIDGTDLLPLATKPPVTEPNAIVAMRNALLAQPKDTAWVVATGTLTNLGLLFATFPEVAEHVRGVSIMGGAIGGGFTDAPMSGNPDEADRVGNTTHWAEFNIYVISHIPTYPLIHLPEPQLTPDEPTHQCDPEAAHSIFSSPILAPKTTLIPLDVTHQVLGSKAIQSLILHGEAGIQTADGPPPTVLRQILHDLLIFFASTYNETFGLESGPPLHDPVAVAVLLSNLNGRGEVEIKGNRDLVSFDDNGGERFVVSVVTDGAHSRDPAICREVGRTVAQPVEKGSGVGGVTIPRGLDVERFWGLIADCIKRADALNMLRN
ncbi:Uridine nucleosidase 1 [Arachnomyces sp. PD_36]|nr:Uridine nucleosidase 1 [Arachnomyces sp. PD_36]